MWDTRIITQKSILIPCLICLIDVIFIILSSVLFSCLPQYISSVLWPFHINFLSMKFIRYQKKKKKFTSQLYFYVLGPSSLLNYQYFNIWKQHYFCNKAIRNSYANQNQGLLFLYKKTIVLLFEDDLDMILMSGSFLLVFLVWCRLQPTLGADSQWFSLRLVLTPSKHRC